VRIKVLPYQMYSRGAKTLAGALGVKRLRTSQSRYKPRSGDVVINWGRSAGHPSLTSLAPVKILNDPVCVALAADKLSFFALIASRDQSVIPPFWTEREEIPEDAYPIVCRTVLNGHSGSGIVMADSPDDLVPAPLYVQYVRKKDEYRVHVGRTGNDLEVFSLQKKVRRLEHDEPNWQIRNHGNGFNYARNDVDPPKQVLDAAYKALDISGLDFGAVDVIWNEQKQRAYVLEINTAPGLVGSTLDDYARFFNTLVSCR